MNTDTFSKANQNSIPITVIVETYGAAMGIVIVACRVHFGTATINDLNQLLKNRLESLPKATLLSRLHRIRPVVYRVLLEAAIPGEIKEQLKNELHAITLQNFAIAQEAERIITLLVHSGVNVIPYKGTAFSKLFYGDISMRESSDIDLIINPNDIDKILPILINDGYDCQYAKSLTRIDRNKLLEQQKDICFDKKIDSRFHVELHWKIIHPNFLILKPNSEFIIQKKEIFQLAKIEHFRAILLHHWSHDGLEYLKTLVDLAQAYENLSKTDANHYLTKVNTNNGLNIVLELVNQIFGVEPFREITLNKIEKRLVNKILKYNLESKAAKTKGSKTKIVMKSYFRYYINQLYLINRLDEKLNFTFRFWIGLLSPKQGDVDLIALPKYFKFFYVFVRPIRLLLRDRF